MRTLLIALCAAGLVGCGKTTEKPKKTDADASAKNNKVDPAVSEKPGKVPADPKGAGETKGTPTKDPAGTKDPAPAASEKALTAGEMRAIVNSWPQLQQAMEKLKKPVEKAGDLPVASWVAAGKAPPEVESVIARAGGDVKTFGRQWARFVQVYGRTVGLPPGLDSTNGRAKEEEDKAIDSTLTKEERETARKEAERLTRQRWADANRDDTSGAAPTAEETEFAFKNRRLIATMFNGVDN